jgi:cell division protein FtsI (penicillin-binding protein 3)
MLEEVKADPTLAQSRIPFSKVSEKEELMKALETLKIKTDVKAPDAQWAVATAEADTMNIIEREMIDNLVPRVVGMGAMDALFLLENKGLKVSIVGSGVVRQQSIMPGTRAVKGHEIIIYLS